MSVCSVLPRPTYEKSLGLTYARVVSRISVGDRTFHHAGWKLQRSRSPEYTFVIADKNAAIRTGLLEGDNPSLLCYPSCSGEDRVSAAEAIFARCRVPLKHNSRVRIVLQADVEDEYGKTARRRQSHRISSCAHHGRAAHWKAGTGRRIAHYSGTWTIIGNYRCEVNSRAGRAQRVRADSRGTGYRRSLGVV